MIDVRYATHPSELPTLPPDELRARFVLEDLFRPGEVSWTLTHHDRILIGGALPEGGELALEAPAEIAAERLCDRREIGVVCIGGSGEVVADGERIAVEAEDIVYVGAGTAAVTLAGDAAFYMVSAPSHAQHPTRVAKRAEVETIALGDQGHANVRTLRKYIHQGGLASNELAMGITTIEPGSVWNTMPCHTHDRRTEIYLYFDLPEQDRIVHLCGQPDRTRSLIMADRQAVISPSWSVHTGAGTSSYKFVWCTAGENIAYNDMDLVATPDLR
ncbi:5-dehydro-4-deoxy-D-glucuronate isomerase [Pseudonocardia sp. TRM90224]|uniref:5-dehydro-4-deoxy-D-glucuronate isomerase n=1 Tax=Pseudonocardia sp. TRM90224 TaxID=2812678 RepID=UPI001E2F114F|nr:5-dehydro-4-deoxy-D-glucuronate isomerase [Pseudonocardia sp. TRM90224]